MHGTQLKANNHLSGQNISQKYTDCFYGKNIIQSGRSPQIDIFNMMINNGSIYVTLLHIAYQHFHQRELHFLDCSQHILFLLDR